MRLIEQTGAIDVEYMDGGVVLTQQSVCGDEPDSVFIPVPLVELVCRALRKASQVKGQGKADGR
jgi:hypothetical protein